MVSEKNDPTPPSATSQLLADAAPAGPTPAAPPDLPPLNEPPAGPRLASPRDLGGDPFDGYIELRLSPEGTQTGPERRKAGTTRGPNITVPLKRMNLRRDADDEQVIRAVAGYTGLPVDDFADCTVLRTDNKMHALAVVRPWPGESEPRLGKPFTDED